MKGYRFQLNKSGINVLVIAGIHGNEHTSIYSVQLLTQKLRKNELKFSNVKEITILNFINQEGIYNFTREDIAGIDLNRDFDKISETKIAEYIKKQIKINDLIIDVHSSFNSTEFCFLNIDQYTNSFIKYLDKIDIKYVINDLKTPTIKNYANKIGKVGFTVQLNQNGDNIDDISAVKGLTIIDELIRNFSKFKKEKQVTSVKSSIDLTSPATGLMVLKGKPGDTILNNQTLGYIYSIDGKSVRQIISPCKGILVAYIKSKGYVSVNTHIIKVQEY